MEDVFIAIVVGFVVIGFPWLVLHYITKWRQAKILTSSDEKLLDDLHEIARRLDDRMCTIERIMTVENPEWRQHCLPGRESDRLLSGEPR